MARNGDASPDDGWGDSSAPGRSSEELRAVTTVSKLVRRRQVVVTEENASISVDHRRREIHVNARWAGTASVYLVAPEDADVVRRDDKLDALLSALHDVDATPVSPDDAVRNATTVHMVLDLVVGVVPVFFWYEYTFEIVDLVS